MVRVTFSSSADSAIPGQDYAALPSSVTIPAGQTSAQIAVAPIEVNHVQAWKDVGAYLDPGDADVNQAGVNGGVFLTDPIGPRAADAVVGIENTDYRSITIADDPAGISIGDYSALDVTVTDAEGNLKSGPFYVQNFNTEKIFVATHRVDVVNGHGVLVVKGLATGAWTVPLTLGDSAGNVGTLDSIAAHDIVTITQPAGGNLNLYVGQDVTVQVKVTKPDGVTPVKAADPLKITFNSDTITVAGAAGGFGVVSPSLFTDGQGVDTITLRGVSSSVGLPNDTTPIHVEREKDAGAFADGVASVTGIRLVNDHNAIVFSDQPAGGTITATVQVDHGTYLNGTPIPGAAIAGVHVSFNFLDPAGSGTFNVAVANGGITDANGQVTFTFTPTNAPIYDVLYNGTLSAGSDPQGNAKVWAEARRR